MNKACCLQGRSCLFAKTHFRTSSYIEILKTVNCMILSMEHTILNKAKPSLVMPCLLASLGNQYLCYWKYSIHAILARDISSTSTVSVLMKDMVLGCLKWVQNLKKLWRYGQFCRHIISACLRHCPWRPLFWLFHASCYTLFSSFEDRLVNSFPLVPHICVNELGRHWFRQWLVACLAPSHCLNQYCRIVNWTLGNKLQWN